jgi:hypothetical protein
MATMTHAIFRVHGPASAQAATSAGALMMAAHGHERLPGFDNDLKNRGMPLAFQIDLANANLMFRFRHPRRDGLRHFWLCISASGKSHSVTRFDIVASHRLHGALNTPLHAASVAQANSLQWSRFVVLLPHARRSRRA